MKAGSLASIRTCSPLCPDPSARKSSHAMSRPAVRGQVPFVRSSTLTPSPGFGSAPPRPPGPASPPACSARPACRARVHHLERLVDDLLKQDILALAEADVRREHESRAARRDAVGEGVGAEAGEDD